MSDPAQAAEQVRAAIVESAPVNHAAWAILGGIVLKVIEAFARLRGSPKDRADAAVAEAGATATIVDAAKDVIEAQREDTQRIRTERDECATRCEALEKSVREIRRDLGNVSRKQAECERRSDQQQREIAKQANELLDARRLLNGMLGVGVGVDHIDTPIHGITPNQVADGVATAKETHGKR